MSSKSTSESFRSTEQKAENVLDLCVKKTTPEPSYPVATNLTIKSEVDTTQQISINSPHESPVPQTDIYENNNPPNQVMDITSVSSSKLARPFKAFPSDPSILPISLTTPLAIPSPNSDEYAEFRQKMLSQVQSKNGTNKNMRRNSQSANAQNADPTYWEKRKKNNEAAKRSRDARRAKEDEIAVRCAFLERENLNLKFKLATVESERKRLHSMLYSS